MASGATGDRGPYSGVMRCAGTCSRKILVIDDDLDIREALEDLLQGTGYRLRLVKNGREGLEALPFEPCLVLLDLMMPVMSGQEFLLNLRKDCRYASLPVIVVTAAGNQVPAPAGATDLVRKPFEVDELLDAIDRHCCAQPSLHASG
jgi:two-component system, chemotaxis family, chemotaxis protein CheY